METRLKKRDYMRRNVVTILGERVHVGSLPENWRQVARLIKETRAAIRSAPKEIEHVQV